MALSDKIKLRHPLGLDRLLDLQSLDQDEFEAYARTHSLLIEKMLRHLKGRTLEEQAEAERVYLSKPGRNLYLK